MVNEMRKERREKRQRSVLEMIVRYHTSTAEPVGSHLLSKDISLSSATIRNIMFELEEMGLIRQPHTSAGRVPTDRGYRVYVDSLMELDGLLKSDEEYTDEAISGLKPNSIEDLILKGLQLCSRLTTQACMASFPTLKIKQHLLEREEDDTNSILSVLYDFEDRLYFDGAHYLAEQPEFANMEKISSVLKVLEDKKSILEILEEDLKERGIKIHIGSENRALEFGECTLITASYSVEDGISGVLGIIGPMRMKYERVIPTVDHIARSITKLFHNIV